MSVAWKQPNELKILLVCIFLVYMSIISWINKWKTPCIVW